MNSIIEKSFIIIFGITMLLFTACSDFLKEENYSSIVADELYATNDGYEGLVNTCYSSLRDIYGGEAYIFCAGTDLYVEGRSTQPEGLSEYRSLSATDTYVLAFYRNLYSGIQLCNTAIHYNSNTEDATTLAQRLAEVRFLRAIDYFELVKHFGGVSIITDMVDEPIVECERNSAEEVYDFIISELKEVLTDLPETTDEFGRATKRAAQHYLAKVYLTRGYEDFGSEDDFNQAASYAEATIDDQGLNLSYSDVFDHENQENEEVIFSVQYGVESMTDVSADGNKQNFYFKSLLGSYGNIEGYPQASQNLKATMYFFDLYNEFDSRWEATFMNVCYERYYDYFDKADERDKLTVVRYYPHTWEVADTAEWRAASSLRSEAVIYPYDETWQESQSSSGLWAPNPKKFDDPNSVFSSSGNTRDIILARLGDTYLVAAEAYYKAGNPTKAAEMINVVRTRAAISGHEAEMQLSASDITINTILDERALELFGEYQRWEDLKRTGTLVERTQLYNRDIKDWFDNGINPFEATNGELKLLRPIPQEALDLNQNDNFTQNPGY